jgi:hypothetical protein
MLSRVIDDLTLADFKFSWTLVIDFNSIVELLHNDTNISEVHAASIPRSTNSLIDLASGV